MQASMSWSFTTDDRRARRVGESVQIREGRLLGPVLGQPLLAPALGFACPRSESRTAVRYPRGCRIVATWQPFTGQALSVPRGPLGCSGLSVGWYRWYQAHSRPYAAAALGVYSNQKYRYFPWAASRWRSSARL